MNYNTKILLIENPFRLVYNIEIIHSKGEEKWKQKKKGRKKP